MSVIEKFRHYSMEIESQFKIIDENNFILKSLVSILTQNTISSEDSNIRKIPYSLMHQMYTQEMHPIRDRSPKEQQ